MPLDKVRLEFDINNSRAISQTDQLTASMRRLEGQEQQTGKEGLKAGAEISVGMKGANQSTNKLSSSFGSLGGMITGALSVGALVTFGKSIVDITSEFQKFEVVLSNTLGSNDLAKAYLSQIKEVAAKTPDSVKSITEAFVLMANQGVKVAGKELTAFADLSSSTGKDVKQLAEAMLDAGVGEFERLKEFGIIAKKNGDMVSLNFKGVTKTIDITKESIKNYLVELGQTEGVAGATAAISETLGGKISNLGDAFDGFMNSIGQSGSPALLEFLDVIIKLLTDGVEPVTDLLGVLGNLVKDTVTGSFSILTDIINDLTGGTENNIDIMKLLESILFGLGTTVRITSDGVRILVNSFLALSNAVTLDFEGAEQNILNVGEAAKDMGKAIEGVSTKADELANRDQLRALERAKTERKNAILLGDDLVKTREEAVQRLAVVNQRLLDDKLSAEGRAFNEERKKILEASVLRISKAEETANKVSEAELKAQQKYATERLKVAKEIEIAEANAIEDEGIRKVRLFDIQQKYELIELKNNLDKKLLLQSEYDRLLTAKTVEAARERNDLVLKTQIQKVDVELKVDENAKKIRNKISDEEAKTITDRYSQDIELNKQKNEAIADARKDLGNTLYQQAEVLAGGISDILFSAEAKRIDEEGRKNQELYDEKKSNLNANLENELISKETFDKESAKLEEENQKKQAEIKKKAFINNRNATLAQIAIETAFGVAKAASTYLSNPVTAAAFPLVAAGIIATGAVQAGLVLAQPVPTFAKGGFTGTGADRDSTGERVAGIVHAGEWVAPRRMVERFPEAFNLLEDMRQGKSTGAKVLTIGQDIGLQTLKEIKRGNSGIKKVELGERSIKAITKTQFSF